MPPEWIEGEKDNIRIEGATGILLLQGFGSGPVGCNYPTAMAIDTDGHPFIVYFLS